ncbi:unnamed protein product, partial [Mesorhabditis belari]|uniref:G-protein coupled receptors family 1 profile domain-containing protein n=1 Tax=Mesorhabditis belari TaxID=2138241 RepID=A0AAF3FIS7_9BILA
MDVNITTISRTYEEACKIKGNPLDVLWVRVVLFSLYCLVFMVAVFGNLLVVYVVTNNRRMHSVTNIFICNLAISDLLVNFTSLWLTPVYTYVGHWIWGGWLCHGLPLFQGASIFISTLTLMAIAVDRYFVIVQNSTIAQLNDRVSITKCVAIVSCIWCTSLLLVLPYGYHMKYTYIRLPCDFFVCTEDWQNKKWLKKIYGMTVMFLQFVVPFTIIGISYAMIWIFLKGHEQDFSARGSHSIQRDTARKKRLLRMLVTMVCLFAMCWLPLNVLNLLRDLELVAWLKAPQFVFLVTHLISMTGTCWNPILYAWMNDSFRKEFMMAIPCLRRSALARRVRTDSVPASVRINCPQSSLFMDHPYRYSQQFSFGEKGYTWWQSIKEAVYGRRDKEMDLVTKSANLSDKESQTVRETMITNPDEGSVSECDESCHL